MARSIKKGPFIEKKLYKRIQESLKTNQKQMIKTYSRSSTIIPEMVGFTISVYN
ncbi:MAG TPA: ribosomal protein S19 family protein, partial [Sphaerochaeta sp.]|nr:ribosomal protein S19 family protein [Sphaerochaeta sp.]